MKKATRVFCGVLIVSSLIMISMAFAQDNLEIGTEVYYFNYEEPDFMEDTGVFFGVNGKATHRFSGFDLFGSGSREQAAPERSLLALDGRFAFGWVDYTSESTGELDNINDYVFETRLTGGYDLNVTEQTLVTPYIGIGYRYLHDDTSGEVTSTGAGGYERESNYLYIPIGADLHGPINEQWSFNINAEFDVFITGKQKSHLGDAVAGLNTVSNDQDSGFGLRGSLRLTKENEKTDFFIEPFIRYWHIDDSQISPVTFGGVLVGYGLEPENDTLEVGAKAGVRF